MGGSKKTTVAYHYRILLHLGICKGPIDALLEIRGGNRVAWQGGLLASGQLDIDKPNLWGGKKKEGGMDGAMDILFGEPAQGTNDYLTAEQGPDQPTYREKVTAVWRGGRFSTNPYPKDVSFKVRRILHGWDGGAAWYPERAEITLVLGSSGELTFGGGPSFPTEMEVVIGSEPGTIQLVYATGPNPDKFEAWYEGVKVIDTGYHGTGGALSSGGITYQEELDNFLISQSLPTETIIDIPGSYVDANAQWDSVVGRETASFAKTTATPTLTLRVYGPLSGTLWIAEIIGTGANTLLAMNPAHILYDSLTAMDMRGEPVGLINDASFRAAADVLSAEGIGLCMRSDEYASVEDMQRQILDIIGGSLTQSRVDGLYYLDLLRPPADIEALPVITADDVIEFRQQPAPGTQELVNQVLVSWRDPERNEERTTAPLQSLGGIQAAGGVISETRSYPEIPTESLALRIGARDLQARGTPLSRFDLVTNRRPWAIRRGTHFRLQLPAEGITDMVCVLADIRDSGLTDGRLRIKAVQDVFSMPATAYVVAEPGQAQPPATTPTSPPHQFLVEVPYAELAAQLSPSELAAFPLDSSAFLAVATRPAVGLNYSLYSAGDGETLEDYATGDWCPTALIVEAADYLDTAFTLASAELLDRVELGTWAQWDNEIVRVVALDAGAGTLTLARACIDTLPSQHAAGSRIYFAGDWYATDGREYTAFEAVTAKLLVASGSAEQALGDATLLSLNLDERQALPYPPANIKINGGYYPASIGTAEAITVTWAHRDRLLQADQIVDFTQASIGPEPGVTYTIWLYGETDELKRTETGLTGTTYTWATEADDSGHLSSSEGDPHWASVKALLPFSGPDGSTTYTDLTGRAVSYIGGNIVTADHPTFTDSSVYSTNATGICNYAASEDWDISTGDFTVDGWFKLPSGLGVAPGIVSRRSIGENGWEFSFQPSLDRLRFSGLMNGSYHTIVAGADSSFLPDAWVYAGVLRRGNTFEIWVGGVLQGSATEAGSISNESSIPLNIGRRNNTTEGPWHGWMSNFRFTKGVARDLSVVPTAPAPGPAYRLNDRVTVEMAAVRGALGSLHYSYTVERLPPPSGA